jgi:adenylate cyclase
MPGQPSLESLLRRLKVSSLEEGWRRMLTEGDPTVKRWRTLFGLLPSDPGCVQCHVPFAGIGSVVAPVLGGSRQSPKNPRYCDACTLFNTRFPGGAEVVLSLLFVDVRGSTALAEKMSASEFGRLMNRFYEAAINVLVEADAMVDKTVGDQVVALFIPGYAGPEHARKAVEAGQALLRATGHTQAGGPWAPAGVGVHTGTAWVGAIVGPSGATGDYTALGDNVNIAARIASKAAAGELLASEAACEAAGLETGGLERRDLELKGKSETVSVRVLHAT